MAFFCLDDRERWRVFYKKFPAESILMISTSVNATKIKFFAVVFLLLLSSVTFAQQSKNPDLSIIADFRTFTHNNAALA
ncbi:MAG: hypothetical protein ONB49_18275, partial [candidate division KSB1 bacterium]|nr:hypothetical protein [candidate division KSB1 bacterium]